MIFCKNHRDTYACIILLCRSDESRLKNVAILKSCYFNFINHNAHRHSGMEPEIPCCILVCLWQLPECLGMSAAGWWRCPPRGTPRCPAAAVFGPARRSAPLRCRAPELYGSRSEWFRENSDCGKSCRLITFQSCKLGWGGGVGDAEKWWPRGKILMESINGELLVITSLQVIE